MADDVEITITTDDQSGPGLAAAREGIGKVGTEADETAPKVKALSDRIDKLGDSGRKSSASTSDQSGRLDKLGDSADETEGKFTGLASGIDGVTTLMDNPSPQEFAQGLADMADGAGNFLVPALKSAGNAVSSMAQRLTGATTGLGALGRAAGVAAGVAGIGALLYAAKQIKEAREEAEIDKMSDEMVGLFSTTKDFNQVLEEGGGSLKTFLSTFEKLLEISPLLAREYAMQAEAAGGNAELVDEMNKRVDTAMDTQKGMARAVEDARSEIEIEADEIKAFNDEVDRMIGKTFGLSEAQARLTLAVSDAAETVKSNREEIGEAATSLDINTEAGANNILMLENLVRAEGDVVQAMAEGGATNAELSREIDRGSAAIINQAVKMGFNREQVALLTAALRKVPRNVTADITVRGREQSIADIGAIQRAINELRGRDVGIRIVGTQVGVAIPGGGLNAHGGITGAFGGGPRGGMTMVGEEGPELVSLPFGSTVHSNPDTERMMGEMGGTVVNQFITIEGSLVAERDVIRRFRDEVVRGGLGVVARS